MPHWTARLEYLFTDYAKTTNTFFSRAQTFNSDFSVQELRLGLNYQFIANPAYNTDRGPVNVFAGRFHWQF